jgi:hypothetical protein
MNAPLLVPTDLPASSGTRRLHDDGDISVHRAMKPGR